jgi:formylglycine-generating enzyme required for sulfatase activity
LVGQPKCRSIATPIISSSSAVTIIETTKEIHYFTEPLAKGVGLEMVLVPSGSFLMGSPDTEIDRLSSEGPQHRVTVPTFFMAQTPVTQAQWQAVANMKGTGFKSSQKLKPQPSRFSGQDLPVENVSWADATEFCDRLSRHTGRSYRLPSEAEWEYACRAGTNTPFHFGETITTDLANYDGTDNPNYNWSGFYGQGPKGIYRKKITSVKSFPANAYGLYDMHGNVWEWCMDDWHQNYDNARIDHAAWVDSSSSYKVMRGGSWFSLPRNCRSAARYNDYLINNFIGFRVMCEAPRTF